MARKALKNFAGALEPLYIRYAEGSPKNPGTIAAVKALDELSLRFAANHGLFFMAEAVEQIAKHQGFPSGAALLEYHTCRSGPHDVRWIPRVIAKLTGREVWTAQDLAGITESKQVAV